MNLTAARAAVPDPNQLSLLPTDAVDQIRKAASAISQSSVRQNSGAPFLSEAATALNDAARRHTVQASAGSRAQFAVNAPAQPVKATAFDQPVSVGPAAQGEVADIAPWSAWPISFSDGGSHGTSAISAAQAQIVLTVGPNGQFQTISAAVNFANADTNLNHSYDIVITPGTYTNDFPTVTRPMTIEVDPNNFGTVLLRATVPLPNQKGIILTTSSLTVRGLTFEGAEISSSLGGNGAGIRDQNSDEAAASLIVDSCTFTGNQTGILQGNNFSETIQIIDSKFVNNGNSDSTVFQHALYVNQAASLNVTGSVFGGQLIGHDIKSRALVTTVTDNRIYDGAASPADGIDAASTSLGIDTPNGGSVTISGNLIVQGPISENSKLVAYGEEGLLYTSNSLSVSNNSFESSGLSHAIGIYDPNAVPVQLSNNAFTGIETPVYPPSAIACYRRGTLIQTPDGEVAIETLAIGDALVTMSGQTRAIRWIGHRAYDSRFIASNRSVLPIRIEANAIAENVPKRDLWVSPEHALVINGLFLPARTLINGVTISRIEELGALEYFHIELDTHDVIFAEGAAAETFIDVGGRGMFHNSAEFAALYPAAMPADWDAYAALLEQGTAGLPKVRAALLARALQLGRASRDPDLHLIVDGAVVRGQAIAEHVYGFLLPAPVRDVTIASRRVVPAETEASSLDLRRLGVPFERAVLRGRGTRVEITPIWPGLCNGFYADEGSHRWTNGRGSLPRQLVPAFTNGLRIEVRIGAPELHYPVDGPAVVVPVQAAQNSAA